jgi:hypothetical protein
MRRSLSRTAETFGVERQDWRRDRPAAPSKPARDARRKFLRFFPGGFYDPKYIDWERA